ncbi:IclR family transcriptional regulator [Bacillus sp. JJ1533]|uniref:IclR family transcriptional regulator n=1 Tax=Bacillus sp. JJ1533 TaxID=3122959 RepID=UPI002FFFB8DB
MDKKYWVPAIERADKVLDLIAYRPNKYRLIDLSKKLEINKSSLFSLLNTLESLEWVKKDKDDTYSLGMRFGLFSTLYVSQFDFVDTFLIESEITVSNLGETVQLSVLDGTDILYVAKKEGSSRIQVVSGPGMRFPAHATAMGKVLLSQYEYHELEELYAGKKMEAKTPYTIQTLDELWSQIESLKENGYIMEIQEAVEGFVCIGVPIRNNKGEIIAAISVTMLPVNLERKQKQVKKEILDLARRISLKAGYNTIQNI